MDTRIDAITPGIWRLSTFVPEIAAPIGFTFNQFLVAADEPLLFHCGPRAMFASVSDALAKVMPPSWLRWISFGHLESDECGSMNRWLAIAPQAQVVHGRTACTMSLNDLADRPPRVLADGETLDLGGMRVRWIDTPHVPHAWESGLMFEETTSTLFSGDLFTQMGDGPPLTRASILPAAIATEEELHSTSLAPSIGPTIRALAALAPERLAVMHGSCFEGDCVAELKGLAAYYERALGAALDDADQRAA